MNKTIHTEHAPAAVGPYSQGVLAGGTLFVSGQIPFVPETMTLAGEGIEDQARQSLKNIAAIVKEAGFSLEDVVKCTVFLKNMDDFAAVNHVYAEFFGDHKPARCAVKVEIDAICVK